MKDEISKIIFKNAENFNLIISFDHGLYLILKHIKSSNKFDEDFYEFILKKIEYIKVFYNYEMFINKVVDHLKSMMTICSKAKKMLLKFDNFKLI